MDDPAFTEKILENLAQVEKDHPAQILRSVGYFKSPKLLRTMADADKTHAFMSIQLKGDDDDTILNNYRAVEHDFAIPGVDVQLAGLQPLANELMGTLGEDQKRAELQGFLRSLTYAMIASVMLSAILSITVLPACLGLLGRHVDDLGVYSFLRVPFFRNWKPTNWWLHWLGARVQKTKTRQEVENGFWGRLVDRVMKRPIVFAAAILVVMISLILPLGSLSLGGISEKYLPPTNSVRQAQQEFDRTFPGFRTETLTLVVHSDDGRPVTEADVQQVRGKAMTISGFIDPDNDPANMWKERPYLDGASKDPSVRVIQNGLVNRNDADEKVDELRSISAPRGREPRD